jgi:hypothetical protein
MCGVRSRPRPFHRGETLLTAPFPDDRIKRRLTKRWGFYPLHDPEDTRTPETFVKELAAIFGMDSVKLHTGLTRTYTNSGSKEKGFNASRRMRLVGVPERIVLTIDPTQPISVVLPLVAYYLKNAQRSYKIRQLSLYTK